MAIPFVFNIAKGRIVEFYNRAENNDPSTAGFILVPCSADDTEAAAQDADTLTAALATAINEQTAGGWVRKTLTDTQLAALPAPDDSGNKYGVQVPSVTWTAPTAPNNTTGLLICYAPDTGGADTTIIPCTYHAFIVTADGNDVVLNVGDFLQAS